MAIGATMQADLSPTFCSTKICLGLKKQHVEGPSKVTLKVPREIVLMRKGLDVSQRG